MMKTDGPSTRLMTRCAFAIAASMAAGILLPCVASAAPPAPTTSTSTSTSTPAASVTPPPASADVSYKVTTVPQYPISAMEHEEQGLVMLDVTVDAGGHLQNVTVDAHGTTGGKDLQGAAVAAVKQWQFNPGMHSGKPTGGVVTVPVSFGIADTCSQGYLPVGRPVSGYNCVPNSSDVPNPPGECLRGFTPHADRNKAYSCIPDAPTGSAPAASAPTASASG